MKRWTAKSTPAFATVPCGCINNNYYLKKKMGGQGYTNSCYHPHLGFKKRRWTAKSTSAFATVPSRGINNNNKNKRWVARGTPTPAAIPLRIERKMDSQGHTNSCYHPTGLKRKDGQPRAHQLLPLSHIGV